ncbi:hypothetical protein [Ancylobacter defluvii]|uniref:Uncharacterized protein n=1 Tax=Ancylobacter defluvii TaxID=1282440 RepID=A0A9W6JTR7_9HYPH|nr:hypothetical protein [Ancylobacter defluvii]MBS7589917.1 hypothetical protein [Ancylobacter defluvii]GLK83042.1 hypothetical protein GCM10017653_11110 [Ancylobacter defluvii]
MMFSFGSALLAAVVGLVLWTGAGYVLARAVGFGRSVALPLAPALGWTVLNALALEISRWAGIPLLGTLGALVLIAGGCLLHNTNVVEPPDDTPAMPVWMFLAAAIVALAPAMAVAPKETQAGIALSPAIFDHSKIALIDAMVRDGVPPVNPFYGPPGEPAGVAYYYLWHFGAAQLAGLTGARGWEADAAASWFTAFSTLMLMAALAMRFARTPLAPALAIALCVTGSLRPVLEAAIGEERLAGVLRPATGFAGWLFQSSWSPHHVAAAGALVIATLLAVRLATSPRTLTAIVLGLVVAGAYQSSIWVGGVVLALAMLALLPLLLPRVPPGGLPRFLLAALVAAALALLLATPLLVEQYHAGIMRGGGSPVAISPLPVLAESAAGRFGRVLDLPAYWLVLLVVEFPLIYPVGAVALWRLASRRDARTLSGREARALGVLTLVSLAASWLLVSTVGDNNDLGWRAVLPGLMVLTAAAGAGLTRLVERRGRVVPGLALAGFAASLIGGAVIAAGNARGEISSDAAWFARAPAMWAAVRRHAPAGARVANNPALFATMTPWPVNISWALLADRRSCFAGNELAIAFAPLSRQQRGAISDQFLRVFAGEGSADDLRALADTNGCDVVLVTARDGAWARDPFAESPLYHLVETEPEAWRVYVATPLSSDPARPASSTTPQGSQ